MSKSVKEQITAKLQEVIGHVGQAWVSAGEVSVMSIEHANLNNHSPDLLRFIFEELNKSDAHTIKQCFVKAVWMCCGITIKIVEGRAVSSFDREMYDKIKTAKNPNLALLKKDGLKIFKPKRAAAKNAKAKQGEGLVNKFEVTAKELTVALAAWDELQPDNPSVRDFYEKLEALKAEVVSGYTAAKPLAQAVANTTLLNKKEEPVVDEEQTPETVEEEAIEPVEVPASLATAEAERKAWLEAELAKLDNAA